MSSLEHSPIERAIMHDLMIGMERSGESNVAETINKWLANGNRNISIDTLIAWKTEAKVTEKCQKCGDTVTLTPIAYTYSHSTMEPCSCVLGVTEVTRSLPTPHIYRRIHSTMEPCGCVFEGNGSEASTKKSSL